MDCCLHCNIGAQSLIQASSYCNSRRWCFSDDGMEISTISRFALNPIIIVLNNNGYGTERPMLDGPFNDMLPWNYYRIPEIIGHGKGFVIQTEDQLEEISLSS